MSTFDQWLLHPTTLPWLALWAAVALSILAACAAFGVLVSLQVFKYVRARASFADLAQPLLEQGEIESLVSLCRDRLATFHDDAAAHYFMGTALHRNGDLRQSLIHLKRVPELQPGWDVSAMVEAIQAKLATTEERPDLRVVPASATADQDGQKDA